MSGKPNAMQVATTAIKPVRPFERFAATKKAGTGIDPDGSYRNFVKNDTYKNIDVHRDHAESHKEETAVKIPLGQVPFGTATCTYRMGLSTDAKLEREKLGIVTRTFPRNATDNVSFEPPEQSRPFQAVFDQIVTRTPYNKNNTSTTPWQARSVEVYSINNRSGSTRDIISHEPMKY